MKKSTTILVCIWLCATTCWAQTNLRSVEQAQIEARNFFQRQSIRKASNVSASTQLELAYTYTDSLTNLPFTYIFNRQGGGYVLVSSHDTPNPIWGYSLEGSCDSTNLPPQFVAMMQIYSKHQAVATQEHSYTPIAPILGTRIWGQSAPFNAFCPTKDGIRTITGCVATAASQIMCVHQWPKQGIGSNSYTWNGQTLEADFSKATYDWEHMRPNCNEVFTQAERDAIGQLVYHVGVACNMSYGTSEEGGSGAQSLTALYRLYYNFGYDANIRPLIKECMSEQAFLDSVHQELSAGRPCYVSARKLSNSGHAFVCDGMDQYGNVHINWGWFGSMNGYYAIGNWTPKKLDTGEPGSASPYTERVRFYIGIRPYQGNKGHAVLTCSSRRLYPSNRLSKQDTTTLYHNLRNDGVWNFSGNYVFMIYSTTQQLQQVIPVYKTISLKSGYSSTNKLFKLVAKNITLPNGNYYLTSGYQTKNDTIPFLFPYGMDHMIPLTITTDSIFIGQEVEADQEDSIPLNFYGIRALRQSTPTQWKLQFETRDFFTKGADTTSNGLLLMKVNSPADDSFLGAYTYSNNSSKTYTISSFKLYSGTSEKNTITTGGDGKLDVSYADSIYSISYRLKFSDTWTSGSFTIPVQRVRAIEQEKQTQKIALSEQQESEWDIYKPQQLKVNIQADTAYFSWHVMIQSHHFAVQIYADDQLVYNGNLDTTSLALYSPKRVEYRWSVANQQEDNQTVGANSLCSTPTNYSPFNMQLEALDDTTIYMQWQVRDTAPTYYLDLLTADEISSIQIKDSVMHATAILLGPGEYMWTVTVYSSSMSILGETEGPLIQIEGEDRGTITSLNATTNNTTIQYTWQGDAPIYDILIYNEQDSLVASTYSNTAAYTYYAPNAGTYRFFVRPTDHRFNLAPYWYQLDTTIIPITAHSQPQSASPSLDAKFLQNGVLYIRHGGKVFNAQGGEIH